jgi:hypothetical protein
MRDKSVPSPLVGEGGSERSEEPGEGAGQTDGYRLLYASPLTRLGPSVLVALSHKGRGAVLPTQVVLGEGSVAS